MELENREKSNGGGLPSLKVTQRSSDDGCWAYSCINGERADIQSIVEFLKEYTDAANKKIAELEERIVYLELVEKSTKPSENIPMLVNRIESLESLHIRY